jgi:biopolymer transport protein ExbD
MTATQARINANRTRGISVPTMVPFASLVLLLAGLFLLPGRIEKPEEGVVPLKRLPLLSGISCSPDNKYGAVVSLNQRDQLSFALRDDKKLQAAIINQVAKYHGVVLNSVQLAALEAQPFLAVDVRQLPQFLALSAPHRKASIHTGTFTSLNLTQVAECITVAQKRVALERQQPVYVSLKIDADASAARVMQLIHFLQDLGINRFNLVTQDQG